MGTSNDFDRSRWDHFSRWMDKHAWWGIGGMVLLVLALGCTPPTPPVVTPQPSSPVAYLIVASPSEAAGATFRASWDSTVVKVVWRAQAVFPEAGDPSGKYLGGVLRFRGGRDTLAVVHLTTKPVLWRAPWKVEITGASYGKARGYEPMGISLVTIMQGVP